MSIQGIKVTKKDIESLNEQNAIFKSRKDIQENNSVDVNMAYFGDAGDMYIDNNGRIIEKQNDGSEVYMGWTDKNKLKKEPTRINSAYDYFDKFPDQNNNELVNGKLNKQSGNTFSNNSTPKHNSNTTNNIDINAKMEQFVRNNPNPTKEAWNNFIKENPDAYQAAKELSKQNNATNANKINNFIKNDTNSGPIKSIKQTTTSNVKIPDFPINVNNNQPKHTEFFNGPIEVDRSAIDNKAKHTEFFDGHIEVDRSAIDNKPKHTEFFDGPIEVDRSAIDNKGKHTEFFDGPIEVDRSGLYKKDGQVNNFQDALNNVTSSLRNNNKTNNEAKKEREIYITIPEEEEARKNNNISQIKTTSTNKVNNLQDALNNISSSIGKSNNNDSHTEFFNGPIEVDRSAIDNKAKHTEFFNGPIEVDRSAIDGNNTNNNSFAAYTKNIPNKDAAFLENNKINSTNSNSFTEYLNSNPNKDAVYLNNNK